MKQFIQVVVLLDPNSSDPYEVIGLLPVTPALEGDYLGRTVRALRFAQRMHQDLEDLSAKEEGRLPITIDDAFFRTNALGVETFILPVVNE